MLENNIKICACRKATKNYKMAIDKMTKTQHGCAEID